MGSTVLHILTILFAFAKQLLPKTVFILTTNKTTSYVYVEICF